MVEERGVLLVPPAWHLRRLIAIVPVKASEGEVEAK